MSAQRVFRAFAAVAGAAVVALGLVLPAGALAGVATPRTGQPLSGSASGEGNDLTWALTGAGPCTAEVLAVVKDCDAVITPGVPVTWTVTTAFSLGPGAVTNLTQSATLSVPGSTSQSGEFSQRVGEGTYAHPWTFAATMPKPPAGEGPHWSYGYASAGSRVCNDWGVCGGPAISLRLVVPPAASSTAPTTPTPSPTASGPSSDLADAARAHLQQFMAAWNGGQGFSGIVSIGDFDAVYKPCIAAVTLVVDPTLKGLGRYDSRTKTITLARDPRTAPLGQMGVGLTIWHECTHWREDTQGDWGVSTDWNERNAEYMTHVVQAALPRLEMMERLARQGAPLALIRKAWAGYNLELMRALRLPGPATYPPTQAELTSWFGFTAGMSEKVKERYVSGTALPGAAGQRLRQALLGRRTASTAPPGEPEVVFRIDSIQAVSSGPTAPSCLTLSSPVYLTSIMTYHYLNHGTPAGTIGLSSSTGTTYGPWTASGTPGSGGVANAYWTATPNETIPAGAYCVSDSDPSTWSWAADTSGRGIVIVTGIRVPVGPTPTPSPTPTPTPTATPTPTPTPTSTGGGFSEPCPNWTGPFAVSIDAAATAVRANRGVPLDVLAVPSDAAASVVGAVQYRVPGKPWRALGKVTMGKRGVGTVTLTVHVKATLQFRVHLPSSGLNSEATSGIVTIRWT